MSYSGAQKKWHRVQKNEPCAKKWHPVQKMTPVQKNEPR